MSKTLRTAAAIACLVGGVANTMALPTSNFEYQDIDYANLQPGQSQTGKTLNIGESWSGVFEIARPSGFSDGTDSWTVPSGYDNANAVYSDLHFTGNLNTQPFRNGHVYFYLAALDGTEEVGMSVVDVSLNNLGNWSYSGSPTTRRIIVEGSLGVDLMLALNNDGQLLYTVQNITEEESNTQKIIVKAAQLQVNVPDGGTTLSLLGLGMLGLAGIRRRFSV